MRILISSLLVLFFSLSNAQEFAGIPASDTLGGDDLAYNPTFVGGVANGGSTSHGIW
jgi:hypothetical protein